MEGEVYRIPETSDTRTGLFAVEIRLENADRLLRPGMVATADIVTASILGYKIPQEAVIFRQRNAYLFTVEQESAEMEMLYWKLGPNEPLPRPSRSTHPVDRPRRVCDCT